MFSIDKNSIQLIPATSKDFSVVQNMVQFYIYDISGYMGHTKGFELNEKGTYFSLDTLPLYWEEKGRQAFLIRVGGELAGFVLINKIGSSPEVNWNMGEFFILRKFQKKGVGKYIAYQCFDQFTGIWEVMVMPGNDGAYQFWQSTIKAYTQNHFQEQICTVPYKNNAKRIIFRFGENRG